MSNLRHFPNRQEAIKRYSDNRCPPGQCMADPARECASTCRYAQAQAIIEANPLPEVPIVFDDIDKIGPARGVIIGLGIVAVAAALAAVLLGTGFGDLLHLAAMAARP
jgi:hypothetical protein